nr:MAG TPA: hypothetical protein [Bacteriophage sp.]
MKYLFCAQLKLSENAVSLIFTGFLNCACFETI